MKAIRKRIYSASLCALLVCAALGARIAWDWLYSPSGLFWAIESHHAGLVCRLLDRGVAPDARNNADETPLMEAADRGEADIVGCLLAHGANVNGISRQNATALKSAVDGQRDSVVRLLLEHGADVNQITTGGSRVLIAAASLGREDYTDQFLKAGADPNARDATGNSALSWACQSGGSLRLVSQLVNNGAKVSIISGPEAMTPLMYAAQSCKPEVLRFLVEHGASVDEFDFEGYDALTWAALQDRSDNVKELVKLGSNVNHRNRAGRTPLLIIAESWVKTNTIQTLIDCGADLSLRGPNGMTARQEAQYVSHMDIADFLTRAEAATKGTGLK